MRYNKGDNIGAWMPFNTFGQDLQKLLKSGQVKLGSLFHYH